MPRYLCKAPFSEAKYVEASTPEHAAEECIVGYPQALHTCWVKVSVTSEDGTTTEHLVEIPPKEPPCDGSNGHEWLDIDSWGHGQEKVAVSRCYRCGWLRTIDNSVTDPISGTKRLVRVSYEYDEY